MANEKGQTAMEAIIIAVVLLGLLLAITIIMVQRNMETNRLSSIQQNTVKCQGISTIITSFNSNKGYSEGKLPQLEKPVYVKNGSLLIDNISCRYSGKTLKQTSNGTSPAYDEDTTGFYLEVEKTYKAKRPGTEVVFCDTAQIWC